MLEIGLIVIFLISAALIYPDIAERIRAMRQNNEIQQTGPTSAQEARLAFRTKRQRTTNLLARAAIRCPVQSLQTISWAP